MEVDHLLLESEARNPQYRWHPLGMTNIAMEKLNIEIMSCPINSMVIVHGYVNYFPLI